MNQILGFLSVLKNNSCIKLEHSLEIKKINC